jgi:hypothetical protein
MKKEVAVRALYDLGCSIGEIDDLMHTEYLRREKKKEMHKKLAITEIVRGMEL